MRREKKSDGDPSLMLAIALTKKIAVTRCIIFQDLEEHKEPKTEETKLVADIVFASQLL